VLSYLLIYLFASRSTVLLQKLTVPQLVKKFPAFYGIRRQLKVGKLDNAACGLLIRFVIPGRSLMQGCEHTSRVLTPTAEIPIGTPMG